MTSSVSESLTTKVSATVTTIHHITTMNHIVTVNGVISEKSSFGAGVISGKKITIFALCLFPDLNRQNIKSCPIYH